MPTEVGTSLNLIEKAPLDSKNIVATLAEAQALAYEGYNPYIKELKGFYFFTMANADLVPKAGVTIETVQALIASIVDSSPATLDTLRELATAVNNDPNFGAGMISNITTINSQITKILSVIAVAPTYTAPQATLTNVSQTVERGASLSNIALNIGFVKKDAGNATGYILLRNNQNISLAQNNVQNEANIIANISYQGMVFYSEGGLKNNNLGIVDPTNHIMAGSVFSPIYTIVPKLKYFFGSVASTPLTSANGRALPSNVWDGTGTINLATGTVNTQFAVLVPSNRSITSVVDTTNLGANITSNYVLVNSAFSLNDAGGNPQIYKLYVMTNAVPYTVSANHQITIA